MSKTNVPNTYLVIDTNQFLGQPWKSTLEKISADDTASRKCQTIDLNG